MNFIGSFSKPFCTNAGSIKAFLFVPVEDVEVESIVIDYLNFIATGITLKAGKEFLTGYSTFERIQVDQEAVDSDNGTIFRPFLSGFHPGYNFYLEKLFTHMAAPGARFIVIVTDNNDERYLLGTLDNGCHFSWKYSSGSQIRNYNGYSFRFYQESSLPRLRYSQGAPVEVPPVL